MVAGGAVGLKYSEEGAHEEHGGGKVRKVVTSAPLSTARQTAAVANSQCLEQRHFVMGLTLTHVHSVADHMWMKPCHSTSHSRKLYATNVSTPSANCNCIRSDIVWYKTQVKNAACGCSRYAFRKTSWSITVSEKSNVANEHTTCLAMTWKREMKRTIMCQMWMVAFMAQRMRRKTGV